MDAPGLLTPKPSSRFFSAPTTLLGRWSAWLLVAALLLIAINSAVIMPWTEQGTGLDMVQRVVNLVVFACVAACGLTGVYAVSAKNERSVVVFASILLLLFALAMNLGAMILGES